MDAVPAFKGKLPAAKRASLLALFSSNVTSRNLLGAVSTLWEALLKRCFTIRIKLTLSGEPISCESI